MEELDKPFIFDQRADFIFGLRVLVICPIVFFLCKLLRVKYCIWSCGGIDKGIVLCWIAWLYNNRYYFSFFSVVNAQFSTYEDKLTGRDPRVHETLLI